MPHMPPSRSRNGAEGADTKKRRNATAQGCPGWVSELSHTSLGCLVMGKHGFAVNSRVDGIGRLYQWLAGNFGLVIAAPGQEPLVVFRFGGFLRHCRFRDQVEGMGSKTPARVSDPRTNPDPEAPSGRAHLPGGDASTFSGEAQRPSRRGRLAAPGAQTVACARPRPWLPTRGALLMGLKELARLRPLQTPTELWLNLEQWEINFDSPEEMGRVLSAEGIRSEIRYVKGRSETRWYYLSLIVIESLIERVLHQ